MKYIITVGTSLYTNLQLSGEFDAQRVEAELAKKIKHHDQVDKLSAEIYSLHKLNLRPTDELFFLASDTTIGSWCASYIANFWHQKIKCQIRVEKIAGLQTLDAQKFTKIAIPHLVRFLETEINYHQTGVVVNITGGFKGVIPFLTLLAMIHQVPLQYIFETSADLITIQPLPIAYSYLAFYYYQETIALLAQTGIQDWQNYKIKNQIGTELDQIVEVADDFAVLSPVGEIIKQHLDLYLVIALHRSFTLPAKQQKVFDELMRELWQRLQNEYQAHRAQIKNQSDFYRYIRDLGEQNDLRHGPSLAPDIFVFKSTNLGQIRLIYGFEAQITSKQELQLILRVYDCFFNRFNHQTYLAELQKRKNFFKQATKTDFIEYKLIK